MINTAKALYDEISRDYKPNKKNPAIPEIFELIHYGNEKRVYFTIGLRDLFDVQFNPKTVKIRYTKIDKETREKKTITKQVPLEQEKLLDLILQLYLDTLLKK